MAESRGPLWTRPAAAKPERLTRETVVAAAVALADREGLDAVSVRRLATELSARPMSLYTFFERKDDLVDLMIDHVLGEMLVPEMPAGDWRAALRAVLHRQIEVGRRHVWVMSVFGTRAPIGPNAAHHAEQSHQAIAGLGLGAERSIKLLRAVDTYLWGYVTLNGQELAARQRDGLSEQEWQESTEAYFTDLTAAGDLVNLAAAGRSALVRGSIEEWTADFDEGLNWLLDGFDLARQKEDHVRQKEDQARHEGDERERSTADAD